VKSHHPARLSRYRHRRPCGGAPESHDWLKSPKTQLCAHHLPWKVSDPLESSRLLYRSGRVSAESDSSRTRCGPSGYRYGSNLESSWLSQPQVWRVSPDHRSAIFDRGLQAGGDQQLL